MFQYILKRILIFIPTFFVISLIIFGLSKMAPGDPVDVLLSGGAGNEAQSSDLLAGEEAYAQKSQELGLDKPVFYFVLTSAAYPKDLYKIKKQHHRELVSRLISLYGNSEAVMYYYQNIRDIELAIVDLPEEEAIYESRRFLRKIVEELYIDYHDEGIRFKLDTIRETVKNNTAPIFRKVRMLEEQLYSSYDALKASATPHRLYMPTFHFFGFANQYHTWMFGDYPWFSTVDSTDHRRSNQLFKEIAKLNIEQDSLNRILRPISAQSRRIGEMLGANDSLKNLSETQVDSLGEVLAELQKEQSSLKSSISPLLSQMELLNTEKDEIGKRLKVYASKGFIRGDFGTSYSDNRPVSTKMWEALKWTLLMNFFGILISYLISIPIGVQSALWKKNSTRFVPFLSLPILIGASIMTGSFYFYMGGNIGTDLHYTIVIACNTLFLIYTLFDTENGNKQRFKLSNFRAFWINVFRLRILNIAQNSVALLKLLYLWVWFILCFAFLMQSILMKIILISIPIAIWGIKQLRKTTRERKSSFKIDKQGLSVKGSVMDSISTTILFLLYSLPSFWIGTLLIVFFTTNTYGVHYDWFPTSGVQTLEIANNPNLSWWTKTSDIMYHMILPIFCITYSSFAYLSRQMRGAMLSVIRQDYIRTANAKGLSEKTVTWKHAFRNSLFPIITLFSSVFPRALSGAIAIELIYNIPGMGMLVLSAINGRDWPVVFTVAMLAAILTMIGNLIADILYAAVDPRVSFK